MKTEQEIIQDIFSHKYYVHGKCFNCGTEFERCTNSTGLKSSCCSDECFKEMRSKNIKRGKERHHYEVFRDDKYYYIKVDGIYQERRNHKGKTWMFKSIQDKLREEDPIFRKDWKLPILSVKSKIPENAITIIDKVSAYLYTKEHFFGKWKELTEVNGDSSQQ